MDPRQMTKEEVRSLYRAVLLFANQVTGNDLLGQELAQEAFERLLTTSPWDESKKAPLAVHLFGIVKSRLSLLRKSKRRFFEEQAGREERLLSEGASSPEDGVLQREAQKEAKEDVQKLRTKLGPHDLETRILDLMTEGITKRAHLVERTGLPDAKVAAALARIRRYARDIAAAQSGRKDEVTS